LRDNDNDERNKNNSNSDENSSDEDNSDDYFEMEMLLKNITMTTLTNLLKVFILLLIIYNIF
jgi:hypothetical protein